jgi:CheY-like chemotaxis protein
MQGKILVVDCNAIARNSLVSLLVERGHDVTHSGDAAVAIELVRSRRFDVVICDQYSRSQSSGAEILGYHYRRYPASGRVLLVTDAGSGRRSAELVGAACLIKPVEHAALLEAVADLIGRDRSAAATSDGAMR